MYLNFGYIKIDPQIQFVFEVYQIIIFVRLLKIKKIIDEVKCKF